MNYMTILATGLSVATGAASASSPIPPASSNEVPRFVRVTAQSASYIKLGRSTVVATGNDVLVQPGDGVVLAVPRGVTHIAYIQSGAVAGAINVVPLEEA